MMDDKFILNSENPQNDFIFFIDNTEKITYYNKGTFGFSFILQLRGGIESPYKYKNNTQINKILLKIVGLCSDENTNTKSYITIATGDKTRVKNYNSRTLTNAVMKKECALQNMVYGCGEKYNIQMCPKMCYCENIMEEENVKSFLQKLIKNCGYTPQTTSKFGMITNFFKKPDIIPESYIFLNGLIANLAQIDGLSVALMEYADGYKELRYDKIQQNFARISLLRLALFCNISHNDPRQANILVNNNNHVLLIDFGSTIDLHEKEKISDDEKNIIIENLTEKKYNQALKLCNKMYKDGEVTRDGIAWTPLDWVHDATLGDYEQLMPLVNELLLQYSAKKQQEIQSNVTATTSVDDDTVDDDTNKIGGNKNTPSIKRRRSIKRRKRTNKRRKRTNKKH